jgi:hypothetical protein
MLTGLPWADASPAAHVADVSGTPGEAPAKLHCVVFELGDTPACGILIKGATGARGARGKTGPIGRTGPQGAVGPQGIQGPVGPQGVQGPQGIQGIQGAPGHTIVLTGTAASDSPSNAPAPQGTLLTAVARCTNSNDPEAYGGGETIQKTGQFSSGDVVTIQSHYLGTYASPTQVNPPSGNSNQAADSFEAQAVVTQLAAGDTATLTPYVVCGP